MMYKYVHAYAKNKVSYAVSMQKWGLRIVFKDCLGLVACSLPTCRKQISVLLQVCLLPVAGKGIPFQEVWRGTVFLGLKACFFVRCCAIMKYTFFTRLFPAGCQVARKETILVGFKIHFVKLSIPFRGGFSTAGCGIILQCVEHFYRPPASRHPVCWGLGVGCLVEL